MNVSIVIPTRNRRLILEETLECIHSNQDIAPENIEVIVINDGEESLDYLLQKYKNLRILKNKLKGAASARNTGASSAKNELFLFIDDDILIRKGCITKHIELHLRYPCSLVSGSWEYSSDMLEMLGRSPFGRFKFKYDYQALSGKEEDKLSDGIYTINSLASFNLSIKRSEFEELKGFNESFPYAGCEDQEFTMRAKEKKFRLILDTTNVTINNEKDRADMSKWLNRQYTGVQGVPMLCELFPYRKKEALFLENIPINKVDTFKLKIKKVVKYTLSLSPVLVSIKQLTLLMEHIGASDKTLFKLYRGLSGLYLYKGFAASFSALQKVKKQV